MTTDATAAVGRPYVYAIGRIEPRFPSLGLEKEFVQATGRSYTAGLTDRQATHAVLVDPEHRYLVRKLCWVFTIEGIETYLLVPRDATDLDMLLDAVRPTPSSADIDVVIGERRGLASPEMCNGLVVPVVLFDQIYSFGSATFLASVPRPDTVEEDVFRATTSELLDRVSRLADNSGATDEHRALNYLAMRYPAIYARTTEQFLHDSALTSVDVVPSAISGVRTLMNVVFTFTDRTTGVREKFAARVDTTEEFPFLASPLEPYFDR